MPRSPRRLFLHVPSARLLRHLTGSFGPTRQPLGSEPIKGVEVDAIAQCSLFPFFLLCFSTAATSTLDIASHPFASCCDGEGQDSSARARREGADEGEEDRQERVVVEIRPAT